MRAIAEYLCLAIATTGVVMLSESKPYAALGSDREARKLNRWCQASARWSRPMNWPRRFAGLTRADTINVGDDHPRPMTPPRWGGAGQVRGSENRQLVSSVGILQHDIAVRAVTLPAPRIGVRHGR